MKGANIMRKSKKVLALLLAASVFSTTFMSNGMPAKADMVQMWRSQMAHYH